MRNTWLSLIFPCWLRPWVNFFLPPRPSSSTETNILNIYRFFLILSKKPSPTSRWNCLFFWDFLLRFLRSFVQCAPRWKSEIQYALSERMVMIKVFIVMQKSKSAFLFSSANRLRNNVEKVSCWLRASNGLVEAFLSSPKRKSTFN